MSAKTQQQISKTKQQQSQVQIADGTELQKQKEFQQVRSQANIGNILEQNSLKSQSEMSKERLPDLPPQTHELLPQAVEKVDESSDTNRSASFIDRQAHSRASTAKAATEKIWTADEILADDELWRVSDSSGDELESIDDQDTVSNLTKGDGSSFNFRLKNNLKAGPSKNQSTIEGLPRPAAIVTKPLPKLAQSSLKLMGAVSQAGKQSPQKPSSPAKKPPTKYNAYERNKDYYEDEVALEDETEQMARYLVDKAPGQNSFGNRDTFNDMQRKTKTERKAIMLREFLLKCQCELAVQRCVRPDLMQQALHKIVGTVYDFNYLSFELDILTKFIDPDGTLAWRRNKMSAQMQTGRYEGQAKNNAQVFSMPARKSAESSIQTLIKEAYEESVPTSPIYFLVTHSINVFDELRLFYQKNVAAHQTKLHHFQVGKGLNKTIEDAITKAAQAGDWILIENIQLADSWIDELELIIAKLDKEIQSNKFRLYLSSVQMDNCPHMILKQSVKIALQQPTGIKLRMERLVEEFTRDNAWRKGPNHLFHKNMYFALSYLHSVLDGRKMYGPLGWNIYSGFDASDFQISNQQLVSYLGEPVKDKETQIYLLKYLYANINFSGKISREEDLRKLNAIIEDLITVDMASAQRALPDLNRGHYGLPRVDDELNEWIEKQLPKQDPCEVYGFNRNSERYVLKVRSFDTMRRLYHLNKKLVTEKAMGYQDLQLDLENQSIRISLAKSSLHTQSASNAALATLGNQYPPLFQDESLADLTDNKSNNALLVKNPSASASQYYNQSKVDDDVADALLPLFVKMQKLLQHSSLDLDIKNDCDRFDEKIDSRELPLRDEYDRKISAVAKQLKNVLSNILSSRVVQMQLPYNNMKAVQNVYANECRQFIALIEAIKTDVSNLLMHIDGKYMKPLDIEKLWSQVQYNVIPNSWRKYAFQTAYISLADFIIELVEKVKFWQYLLKNNSVVPAVWVPGFFDPSQYLNALIQRVSREDKIPARMIKNTYHITDILEPSWEKCPAQHNVAYIYGLWLEGASWDIETQLVVEQTNSAIYDKFPVVKITTEKMTQAELDKLDGTLSDFDDNPPLSKRDQLEKVDQEGKLKEQMEREDKLRLQISKDMSKSKLQKDRDAAKGNAGGMSNVNSRMGSSRHSLRESRDSNYNFKRQESGADEDTKSMASHDTLQSKVSKKSKASRKSSRQSDNDSQNQSQQHQQSTSQHKSANKSVKKSSNKPHKRGPPSGLSDLAKKEFAEDSREDEESSNQSGDEGVKARKWRENIYYYKCPVFRTTLRLRTGEISSDNKPVFYIKLPSLTHPRKWVKRSVALLMETYR